MDVEAMSGSMFKQILKVRDLNVSFFGVVCLEYLSSEQKHEVSYE